MAVDAELTVRSVMTKTPVCLGPDKPVQCALDRMNQHRVGAVLIANEDRLEGIFTERDFLRRSAVSGPGWRDTPLREWMSPNPFTIGPDAGWEEAVTSMQLLRVRHLPVVESGRIVGVVSARQLLAHRAEHQNRLIEERTRDLKRANDELLARDLEMTHYMKVAARLQRRLVLPVAPPSWSDLRCEVHYEPLDPLGGDYYDFVFPSADHLGILIADASGHGIPAAMVAIMTRMAFREVAPRTARPAEVLEAMNARLQDLTDERFVTAFYGVLHRPSRQFVYANAGHPFPFRYSAAQHRVEPLSARGFLLGVRPDEVYREREVQLEPGDRLCLFTDGVPDCRNAMGEPFGTDRLVAALGAMDGKPVEMLTAPIVTCLRDFQSDQKATDDVTLVIVAIE